jgi:alpha-L-arabinofuranosidase
MIKQISVILLFISFFSCQRNGNNRGNISEEITFIDVFIDSILSDVSHRPVGINLNYFMDDDNYLNPATPTTEALRTMGVKYLRYPGGNKADFYFFSKPPYERSEPTLARTGKGAVGGRGKMLKNNQTEFRIDVLDFDEFIQMCRDIDAEPVIVVAADEYLADYPQGSTWSSREELIAHAVEWVRYSNVKKNYNVKYWMIGNESWHKSNPNSTAEIYAKDVVDFSKAMKAVDPTIYIIPNGNSTEFWKEVITVAGDHVDHLCISNYPVFEYKAGYATYRDTLQSLMHPIARTLTAIDQYATPEQKEKWKLIIAEYGPFDWGDYWPKVNDMGMNLANFEMTGKQLEEPAILFSCFWNTRWIHNDSIDHQAFDALDKDGNLNANGLGLMIWGNYLGDKMVKTTGSTQIRSFASSITDQNRLYVYLLNKAETPAWISLQIPGYKIEKVNESWELVGAGPNDVYPKWRKKIDLDSFQDENLISLPGTSIVVIDLGVARLLTNLNN